MRIKIDEKNAQKIHDALEGVNSKAHTHTISSFSRVAKIAEAFEADLASRGVAKSRQRGAIFEYTPDGKDLPKTYGNSAITTKIVIERGSKGCFLIDVERDRLYPGSSGTDVAHITEEQADLIRAKAFRGVSVSEKPMSPRQRSLEKLRRISEKNLNKAGP